MKSKLACGLSLCGLMTAGGAMLAAPGQTTQRPGEMTEARVWVQNRAKDEAVAVTVQDVAPDATMHVLLIGTPSVALAPATSVLAKIAWQTWDYESVTVASGQDPAPVLGRAGSEGWEATGLQFATSSGAVVVVLKRPR